jgi:hypothetical protein
VGEYYDPNDGWRPPSRRKAGQRQSTLSVALEALGGGLVIALLIFGVLRVLGWR